MSFTAAQLTVAGAAGYFAVFGTGFVFRPAFVERFGLRWTEPAGKTEVRCYYGRRCRGRSAGSSPTCSPTGMPSTRAHRRPLPRQRCVHHPSHRHPRRRGSSATTPSSPSRSRACSCSSSAWSACSPDRAPLSLTGQPNSPNDPEARRRIMWPGRRPDKAARITDRHDPRPTVTRSDGLRRIGRRGYVGRGRPGGLRGCNTERSPGPMARSSPAWTNVWPFASSSAAAAATSPTSNSMVPCGTVTSAGHSSVPKTGSGRLRQRPQPEVP